jgi:hypothetical protein
MLGQPTGICAFSALPRHGSPAKQASRAAFIIPMPHLLSCCWHSVELLDPEALTAHTLLTSVRCLTDMPG